MAQQRQVMRRHWRIGISSQGIFLAACLLAASGLATPSLPFWTGLATASTATQAGSTATLSFSPVPTGVQALSNGNLNAGAYKLFQIPGNTCAQNDSFLLELWDLESGGTGKSFTESSDQAQPFLVGNRGSAPIPNFNATSNAWYFEPNASVTDIAGESLNRPYLQVQESFGVPGSDNTSDWFVMILNAQSGMPQQLMYQLRVSCTAVPLCPAPVWAGNSNATEPCSGNGDCQTPSPEDPEKASCDCIDGWGGSGCNQQVTELTSSIPQLVTGVPGGEWRYFSIYLPNQTAALVAEMRRARGDPILFLKGEYEGEEPGALPSALDFGTFADAPSWRTRSDTAQILRTNVKAGMYYVGILNNAEDIQEAANYSLTVRASQQGPLCPWNCNGNGNCLSNGVCNCNAGFGGKFCDGPLTPLSFSNTATGVLQPGSWAYFRLDLTNRESRTKPLTVRFDNSAGQSIVLASFSFFPTLLNNNFTFRAGQITGQMSQVLQPNSLIADDLNFGIYNMNFYVHSLFNFQLSVSQNKSSKADYTSWISVGAALGCSGLIVFLIYHGHRAVQRRRLGARGWEMWSWRAMPVVQPESRRRRSVRRRGLDPALVQSFPTYTHDAEKLARGISQTPKSDQPSEDEKSCSVCLGEYEDGDLIRQLIPCRHDFHCKCIDQWLGKNSTCPMCRILLVPPDQRGEGETEEEAVGGGSSAVAEPPASATQEVRIEMIQDPEAASSSRPHSVSADSLNSLTSETTTLPSSQHSVAGSSFEGRHKPGQHDLPET